MHGGERDMPHLKSILVDTARIDSEMGCFEAPSQLRHGFRLHVCALGGRGIIKSDVFLEIHAMKA